MPESYTYIHIATHAMLKSGRMAENIPVYYAGANGPDPLFMYRFFHKQGAPLLNSVGGQIQQEQTGAFLLELLKQAKSAQQRSFAQGFLTHYASACTLNPYIVALDGKGPYTGTRERRTFEAAIDATLYYSLYKTERVPALAGTPVLVTEDLAQVTALLSGSLKAVYGADVPVVMLADAYHNNTTIHRALAGKGGLRRFFVRLAASFNAGQKASGDLFARAQPVPRLGGLPASWQNPYTQEEHSLSLEQMTARAEDLAAEYLRGAEAFWQEELSAEELLALLGNNNYLTGQPVSGESVPDTAAPAAPDEPAPKDAATPAAPTKDIPAETAEAPAPTPQTPAKDSEATPPGDAPSADTSQEAPQAEAVPEPTAAGRTPPGAPEPVAAVIPVSSGMAAADTTPAPPQEATPTAPASSSQPEAPTPPSTAAPASLPAEEAPADAKPDAAPCTTHPVGTFLPVDAPPTPVVQPGHTAPHWQGQAPSAPAEAPSPATAPQKQPEPATAQPIAPLPTSGTPTSAAPSRPLSATAQFAAIKPDAPAAAPPAPPAQPIASVPPAAPSAASQPPAPAEAAAPETPPAAPAADPALQPDSDAPKADAPAQPAAPASEAAQGAPSAADRRKKLEDALAWASGKPVYMPPSAPAAPAPSAPDSAIQPGVPYKRKKK